MRDDEKLLLGTNTVRTLAIDMIQEAASGHPGLPLGAAQLVFSLYVRHLRFDPTQPRWLARDRFILSAGHGSSMLYALLHLFGYALSLEDLRRFRQLGSRTPGHPEFDQDLGLETTTGPLGQGLGNAIGQALAGKMLAERTGRPDLFGHRVVALCGDGDLMEGVAHEAASLAGHLGLDNLVLLYDDNGITIDGSTSLAFTEDVPARFRALGWRTMELSGHDQASIDSGLAEAFTPCGRPTLVAVKTTIGFGSPNKAGKAEVHGSPLGAAEVTLTKQALGWRPTEPFTVPQEVRAFCAKVVETKKAEAAAWNERYLAWRGTEPAKAELLDRLLARAVPKGLFDRLRLVASPAKEATRKTSSIILNELAAELPSLVGGSADLSPSTLTVIKGSAAVQKGEFGGRNIHFGIREHGMAAICNGLAQYGGFVPFCSTFLVFADYLRPSLRLAAMMKLREVFVFTHDSFMLGEDGPTHQPVEQTGSLRLIPGLDVFRPYDRAECLAAWEHALTAAEGPVCLLLSRQTLEYRWQALSQEEIARGAYVLRKERTRRPDIILLATGAEVGLALEAADLLQEQRWDPRVVSVPCRELFLRQDPEYRQRVLGPDDVPRLVIEPTNDPGWSAFLGSRGTHLGLDHYGASAPAEELAEAFGFTAPAVVKTALAMLPR